MDPSLLFFASSVGAFAVGLLVTGRRQKEARFEAAILKLRAALDAPVEYRVLGQSEAVFAALTEAHPQLAS